MVASPLRIEFVSIILVPYDISYGNDYGSRVYFIARYE